MLAGDGLAEGRNHQFMRDDETDLEHVLRLNVRWRRHAGQTSLRECGLIQVAGRLSRL